MKIPFIEASNCILCEVCTSVCPLVFRLHDLGYIEVIEMDYYPDIDEAIKNCPGKCIYWEEK